MEQLELYFADEEIHELKNVFKVSFAKIRKKYPRPVEGESIEEYKEFLIDESLLEAAEQIKEIVLRRQKTSVDALYRGIKFQNIRGGK